MCYIKYSLLALSVTYKVHSISSEHCSEGLHSLIVPPSIPLSYGPCPSSVRAAYVQRTCSVRAAYVQCTCAAYVQRTCSVRAAYVQCTCAAYVQRTCSVRAAYVQHSCSVRAAYAQLIHSVHNPTNHIKEALVVPVDLLSLNIVPARDYL